MTALEVGVFLLAQFGLAYVAGHSTISLPFRELLAGGGWPGRLLVALVECPACFGFWNGVAASVLYTLPAAPHGEFLKSIFTGLVVSGSNFILGRVTRLI